ncbi:MAG: ABC transporter substrate-binding protein [Chromatiales bacterium]|nr:ABC transporter substrate-binding protein [Gammaproteobacteria bacterium]MBW6477173.1 ABC transporter substrate-binding protein [Chromatiales bacterium]
MTEIRITALRHSAFYAPLLVTIAGGFLQRQGLQPVYRPAEPGASVEAMLRSGEFHLSQSAVATSFVALERGESCDIVHFAQINERDGFFIAGRNAQPDFRWQDLIGKQVLVDHFFQPLAMLRYGLHRQGIALDDLQVIDAGDVAAMDRAFRDGRGEYIHQQGPFPQQLAHEGIAYPLAAVGDAVGPVAFSSLCASRDWLQSEMAVAFMHAYREARQFVIDSPAQEIARLLQRFLPQIDPAVLAETIRAYQGLGCWSREVVIGREGYERLLDVFLHSGAITKRHAYESCMVTPPV